MRALLPLLPALALLALPLPARPTVYTWVDEVGVTHVVDDLAAVPPDRRGEAREGRTGVRGLWEGGVVGPEPDATTPTRGLEEERIQRLLRGAMLGVN